jgi:hypothetical protein
MGKLSQGGDRNERDVLLVRLALAQLDLGGTGRDVDQGKRIKWDEVLKDVAQTLRLVRGNDARFEAIRLVARKLAQKGQPDKAAILAAQVAPASEEGAPVPVESVEAIASAGLEVYKTSQPAAEKALTLALDPYERPAPAGKENKKGIVVPPSLAALCKLLGKEMPGKKEDMDAEKRKELLLLGEAEKLARDGDIDAALDKTQSLKSALKWQAVLAIATASEGNAAAVEAAANVAAEHKGRLPGWQVLRLVRLGTKSLPEDRLNDLVSGIREPALRGAAQVELLQAKLAKSNEKLEDSAASGVEGKSGQRLARFLLARHNARRDGGMSKVVEGWEDAKPIGLIGVALGLQSK